MLFSIESSCDESAIAVFDPSRGIIAERVHSQIALHSEYGGVVPELASREHLNNFPVLLKSAEEFLKGSSIDGIAVTYGPGLASCLAVGLSLGKAMALRWGVPLIGVNHLRGHSFSPFIGLFEKDPNSFSKHFQALLPHLGLIVSGGNTLLFRIDKDYSFKIIAQTVDDAAGEALDKGAKLLGLGYPGGPLIEKTALQGSPSAYNFPRAFYHSPELKFSFSGLKTSLRYKLEAMDDEEWQANLANLCASYQEAVIDAVQRKTHQAIQRFDFASVGLSGGVANNKRLRAAFKELAQNASLPLFIAEPKHTGDNAAMIAFTAHVDPQGTRTDKDWQLSFQPALSLVS